MQHTHGCPITWLLHHMRLREIQSINASHGIVNPAVDLSCSDIGCPHLHPLHRLAWGVPWSNCSSAAGHWRGSCMTRGVRCRCGEEGGGRGAPGPFSGTQEHVMHYGVQRVRCEVLS